MAKKVIVHGKKRVYDGFFKLDEVKVSYEKFDGRMGPVVSRLSLERGDSVAAVVFNTDTKKIILVNQFRYSTYEKGSGWISEIVAGMIDGEESPEQAIRREVQEETGYTVSNLEKVALFYLSPGSSSERILLFYAEVDGSGNIPEACGADFESEDILTVHLTVEEAKKEIADGNLADAKTIIGIMWLINRAEGL